MGVHNVCNCYIIIVKSEDSSLSTCLAQLKALYCYSLCHLCCSLLPQRLLSLYLTEPGHWYDRSLLLPHVLHYWRKTRMPGVPKNTHKHKQVCAAIFTRMLHWFLSLSYRVTQTQIFNHYQFILNPNQGLVTTGLTRLAIILKKVLMMSQKQRTHVYTLILINRLHWHPCVMDNKDKARKN